jgi:hypothetical protein
MRVLPSCGDVPHFLGTPSAAGCGVNKDNCARCAKDAQMRQAPTEESKGLGLGGQAAERSGGDGRWQ